MKPSLSDSAEASATGIGRDSSCRAQGGGKKGGSAERRGGSARLAAYAGRLAWAGTAARAPGGRRTRAAPCAARLGHHDVDEEVLVLCHACDDHLGVLARHAALMEQLNHLEHLREAGTGGDGGKVGSDR